MPTTKQERGRSRISRISSLTKILVHFALNADLAFTEESFQPRVDQVERNHTFYLKLPEDDPHAETRKLVGTAWTVDVQDPNNQNQKNPDPKPTFIGIYNDNVYVHKLPFSWMKLKEAKKNRKADHKDYLYPLFKNLQSEITAVQMEGAGDILTLAFKNSSLITLNVQKLDSSGKKEFSYKIIELKKILYREDEHIEGLREITSIGHVPYTDHLILAPNSQNFMKVNRVTGEFLKQVEQ